MNAHHKKVQRKGPVEIHQTLVTGIIADQNKFKKQRIWTAIDRIPFGGELDIILPSFEDNMEAEIAEKIAKVIAGNASYYLCPAVNLAELLEPEFMNSFLRKGSLIALSETDSGTGDVVCIDGKGRLVLNVCKDTYELLGLPGRPSRFGPIRNRFVIEIDLRESSFRKGKTGFERVKKRLLDWPTNSTFIFNQLAGVSDSDLPKHKTFSMRFRWVADDRKEETIKFPSSILSHLISPEVQVESSNCLIPLLETFQRPRSQPTKRSKILDSPNGMERSGSNMLELREWLNLVMEDDQQEGGEKEHTESTFLEGARKGKATFLHCEGFFHPLVLRQIIETILNQFSTSTPFISLKLVPSNHSPLSHLTPAVKPIIGTRKKKNGKTVRQGRGNGDDEEGDGTSIGWETIIRKEEGEIEFATWRRGKALDAKQDFEDVGKSVKAEMARFDKEKVEDFKSAVDLYSLGLFKRQREVVAVWQEYFDMLTLAAADS